jgi:hypothetical protein
MGMLYHGAGAGGGGVGGHVGHVLATHNKPVPLTNLMFTVIVLRASL